MKIFKDEKNIQEIIKYCVIGIVIISFYFMLLRIEIIAKLFNVIFSIIKPFVIGIIIAFLLKSPMNFIELNLLKKLNIKDHTKHSLAVFTTIIFGLLVLTTFILLIAPQFIISVNTLILNFNDYYNNLDTNLAKLEVIFNIDLSIIIKQIISSLPPLDTITSYVLNILKIFLPNIVSSTFNLFSELVKVIVGIIICTYLLIDKNSMLFEMKRTLYAFLPNNKADHIVYIAKLVNRSFTNYISGTIMDSFIMGILCYIGMSIFQMPYALLISVIVGITNVIPFFGPFIGAIPGSLIVLVASPTQCIWFILFILILQQIDGNIMVPHILGDSVGVPAIWVLFAILVGGGLFGIPGMIVGVPTFSVLYTLSKERIQNNLNKKQLAYDNLNE